MGSQNVVDQDPLIVLEEALRGGITFFQFREKGTGSKIGEEKIQFAKECQALCKSYHVPFIVNDDVSLAIELDADGVHIGQDDADALETRQAIGEDKILGISAHSLKEVAAAIEADADYIGVGPVYATTSKEDAEAPTGTALISKTTITYPELPVVGIGGITKNNVQNVLQAGADGISVISAIASQQDVFNATQLLLSALSKS